MSVADASVLTILLLASSACSSALQLQSGSRLLDESVTGADPKKVGDGPGRPLFGFNAVTMPKKADSGSVCIGLRVDASTSNKIKVEGIHSIPVGGEADPDAYVAKGCFLDVLATTGWTHLNVTASPDTNNFPLSARAYGSGVVEGLLTYQAITDFNGNVKALLKKDLESVKGIKTKEAIDKAIRMSLIAWEQLAGGDAGTAPTHPVAKQGWASLLQMRGIRDGYNILALQQSGTPLSMYDMMVLNMHSELPALVDIFSRSEQSKILSSFLQTSSVTRQRGALRGSESQEEDSESITWERWASHMPRGSAVVRRQGPVGAPEDLLSAHVAHGNYGEMLRVMKTIDCDFGNQVTKVIMTSYPACISSTDDYYITNGGFVLMSTDLYVPYVSMYSRPQATNEGLPSFVRTAVATRLAVTPREWAKAYSYLTGIAGGKQWLIADYSQVKEGAAFTDGTVFMAEAMPTLTRMGDVTKLLNDNGFVEAHGSPHFLQIREIYGLPGKGPGAFKEHLGSALLDKATAVSDLSTGRGMLFDMLPPRGSAVTGIQQIPVTARNDLPLYGTGAKAVIPEGGLDAKITSRCLVKALSMQAISGPAYNGLHPAFDWNDFQSWPHSGLPQLYNFDWAQIDSTGANPLDDTKALCTDFAITPLTGGSTPLSLLKMSSTDLYSELTPPQ